MTLIAQITDLHLRPSGLTCYRVSDTNMLAERAIRAILGLEHRPDAVVITGDLTDRDDPREYALARHILARLPMPIYMIPGNHDTSEGMRSAFSDYPGISEASGEKLYYTADIGSLRLIALDSNVPGNPHGLLGKAQLDWLSETLAADDRPTMLAIHHPPASTGIPHMDNIGLMDSEALAEVIAPHTHVERIICGHVHRPIVAAFAGKIMTLAPSVAHQLMLDFKEDSPSMFSFEPAAYFLHQHTPKSGTVTHTAYVENYPGPFPFWSDEGVTWPGDKPE
ncbi:phosphodiesterase [Roseibium polysiphoniae]|uniref:phosphodiesterase n=1 Tax=Roseibium polysiphoniae TaxID=2571221 RepID=UPI00259A0E82|nr:phosphodiesterase [uncultured Roseibium sp.]